MNRSPLMPIDDALSYLLDQVSPSAVSVEVPLSKALSCVLAESLQAEIDVPAHDNSAMDGFAVRCSDLTLGLKGGQPSLAISQTIAAGYVGEPLAPNSAARIFTGAPIPEGADAVVIQEDTTFDGEHVTINELPSRGKNIRLKGHDISQGESVLNAGHLLKPHDMGLLSSLGISNISVYKPLTVAIINTGDEIVSPDSPLGPGQIYDSNSFTLDALLQKLGFKTLKLGIVADDLSSTEKALAEAAEKADCIITTGGVSVGDEDHVKAAVENLGELALWKLAIKPGKPFSFGKVNGKPFFGLPGNPVAVFVTFALLVKPCLFKIQGQVDFTQVSLKVKAGFSIDKSTGRQEYIRVRLVDGPNGEQMLDSFSNQGSSIMTSLSWADGLAIIPVNSIVKEGDYISYMPFSGLL